VDSTAKASLPFADKVFRGVELNSKLLGAYLSVFYRYATLDVARGLFEKVFEDVDLERTPRICPHETGSCWVPG
jgi:hypothetical protein